MQMIITRKDAEARLKKIFNIEHFYDEQSSEFFEENES